MCIYNVSIRILIGVIRVASFFNAKARFAIQGRKHWREKLKDILKNNNAPIIWFHVSSLGEFEQARPLIIRVKKQFPHYKLLLSFFSPSGYNARKDFEYADYVFYLPYDTPANARDFLKIVQPSYVFFVKYEFWLNFLNAIQKSKKEKSLNCFLVSSIFRKHQPFFKWYGRIFRKALLVFDTIFVQDELSVKLLKKIGITNNVVLSGDTRVDRVIEIAHQNVNFPEVESFCKDHFVLIGGSTWPPDEQILIPAFYDLKQSYSHLRCIIAPHQANEKSIQRIISLLQNFQLKHIRYTQLQNYSSEELNSADVLLIDTIGILNKIYRFAQIAYIGGGFSDGIHNILEPAVYGLPVLFGKKHEKFYEAAELLKTKAAFEIHNKDELQTQVSEWMNKKESYKNAQNALQKFITTHQGAVEKTMKVLESYWAK